MNARRARRYLPGSTPGRPLPLYSPSARTTARSPCPVPCRSGARQARAPARSSHTRADRAHNARCFRCRCASRIRALPRDPLRPRYCPCPLRNAKAAAGIPCVRTSRPRSCCRRPAMAACPRAAPACRRPRRCPLGQKSCGPRTRKSRHRAPARRHACATPTAHRPPVPSRRRDAPYRRSRRPAPLCRAHSIPA